MRVTVRMVRPGDYTLVVARLDPQQVRMLVRPGVDDNDGAVLRDLTGRFCSGVAINPNEFPEACKFGGH